MFEELQRLVREDIIERCNSKFSSPAFVIEKKNKDIRLVIDYRQVNKYVIDEIFYIPDIHENLLLLSGNKYYSKIDLKNGFNQIEITPESRLITGFHILWRHFQYKRIPFGLKSGPKLFQKIISKILEDIKNVFVYIDDIIIYGSQKEEHDKYLMEVLKRLYKYNVRINFEKSCFLQEEIEVLGCVVNVNGIMANIKNMKKRNSCKRA